MKTFAPRAKQSVPTAGIAHSRAHVHHPMRPAQLAQRSDIRHILHTSVVQAKLAIGENGGKYDQKADRIADQVMRMPKPILQRQAEEEKEEEKVQTKSLADQNTSLIQKSEEEEEKKEEVLQGKFTTSEMPAQRQHDVERTKGMPRPLRTGLEALSGVDLSGVRVHKNSSKPAQLNALAYTQGQDIYVGTGQEKHLPHEGWHAVQQIQGRVQPTMQTKGVSINDDARLEREADVMGAKALQKMRARQDGVRANGSRTSSRSKAVNAHAPTDGKTDVSDAGSISPGHARNPGQCVQRQGEDLRSSRFSGNRILERAFDDRALVSQNHNRNGAHVRLIQDSLLAQGYTLPVHGADSDFGPETEAAVRAFQVDAGAELLDGIVGPETMRLLDMHDPGGTTCVPPAIAATAVFSESANETFAGYDASAAPNWLVVPSVGRRRAEVAITPAGARPTYVSDTPGVAAVDATNTGIVVTGVSPGTARIQAFAGPTVLDTLRVSVKNRVDHSVAFHYVSDSRPIVAGGPHTSNGTPAADEMRSLLNRVWERQSNVRFTGGASHNVVVPGDLGPAVDWTTGLPGGGEWGTVVATGAGADYNVFRVWRYMQDGVWPNDAANLGNNTLIGDNPCADGLGLPHEAGHFLGLNHGHAFIMTPCGGRADRRVSKAMADVVNP